MVRNPLLSILICTVTGRVNSFLPGIVSKLEAQTKGKPVEIIYLGDNKSMTVGEKRNHLLACARGVYTVFIDDDDRVSGDYVDRILNVISKSRPDVVCFTAHISINGDRPKKVMYSKSFKRDHEKANVYYRIPNHLCIVKASISKSVKFKAINYGEDRDWSLRLLPRLKTEIRLPQALYYYDYNHTTSEARP